jgi:hypothetical protein
LLLSEFCEKLRTKRRAVDFRKITTLSVLDKVLFLYIHLDKPGRILIQIHSYKCLYISAVSVWYNLIFVRQIFCRFIRQIYSDRKILICMTISNKEVHTMKKRCERVNVEHPSVSKYLSLLIFSSNFDHSSY